MGIYQKLRLDRCLSGQALLVFKRVLKTTKNDGHMASGTAKIVKCEGASTTMDPIKCGRFFQKMVGNS